MFWSLDRCRFANIFSGQIIRPGIDTKWGENVLVLDCQVCKQEEIEEFETCCKG